MLIRKSNPEETESIIKLLQASLGESLLKKSTEVWNFKHFQNPFGESYVLVAEEDNTLIGVRALMQWRWQLADKVWTAYRAVDTATHPNHQGKGIFTKLTLQALSDIQQTEESFVFNTPNEKSRPGYLKMGWQQVGNIKVALIPTFFYGFCYLFSSKKADHTITVPELEVLCEKHNAVLASKDVLFTPKSAHYLKWRYEENPLQDYIVVSTSEWYVALYVKRHKYFNEMRVAEVIGDFDKKNYASMRQTIGNYAVKHKCLLISAANPKLFRLRLYGNYGPMLTFRSLTSFNEFVQKALTIENWDYSIGDLELF